MSDMRDWKLMAVIPEGWTVRLFRLPNKRDIAVAAHPDHEPRSVNINQLPLAFDEWPVLRPRPPLDMVLPE